MATVLLEYGVNFWAVGALPLGVGLDLMLGGLPGKPEPSTAIAPLVGRAERGLRVLVARHGGRPKAELAAGMVLAVVVVGLIGGLAWLAVEILNQSGGPATLIGRSLLIFFGLSSGRLGADAIRASEADDPTAARRAAADFLGLDAARLDRSGVRRACVLGIGERANRRIVAPLFWLAIGGPAGLWAYQAIDTLRALVVEAGPRSRFFGFASARLDDLANFVPARLTWLLLALSAALLGQDAREAFRFGLGQGRLHPERPGAWGMATMAAALGVQPGGAVEPGPGRRAAGPQGDRDREGGRPPRRGAGPGLPDRRHGRLTIGGPPGHPFSNQPSPIPAANAAARPPRTVARASAGLASARPARGRNHAG